MKSHFLGDEHPVTEKAVKPAVPDLVVLYLSESVSQQSHLAAFILKVFQYLGGIWHQLSFGWHQFQVLLSKYRTQLTGIGYSGLFKRNDKPYVTEFLLCYLPRLIHFP